MLTGKSVLHVNQGLGKFFRPDELAGYYNDLTEKVTKDAETLEKQCLPTSCSGDGKLRILFR